MNTKSLYSILLLASLHNLNTNGAALFLIEPGEPQIEEDAKPLTEQEQKDFELIYPICEKGDLARAKELIEGGANVNAFNRHGSTALGTAVLCGHKDIVQLLLENEANVNVTRKNGGSILLHAVQFGNEKILKLANDNKFIVNKADFAAKTAFVEAVYKNRKDIVQLLLDYGADVNADDDGFTPLMKAVDAGYERIIELLEIYGADSNSRKEYWEIYRKFIEDGKNTEIAKLLIDNKANVNATNKGYGFTALTYATNRFHGNEHIVKLLLDNGADFNLKTFKGEKAIDLARKNELFKIFNLLNDEPLRRQAAADKQKEIIASLKTHANMPEVLTTLIYSYLPNLLTESDLHKEAASNRRNKIINLLMQEGKMPSALIELVNSYLFTPITDYIESHDLWNETRIQPFKYWRPS